MGTARRAPGASSRLGGAAFRVVGGGGGVEPCAGVDGVAVAQVEFGGVVGGDGDGAWFAAVGVEPVVVPGASAVGVGAAAAVGGAGEGGAVVGAYAPFGGAAVLGDVVEDVLVAVAEGGFCCFGCQDHVADVAGVEVVVQVVEGGSDALLAGFDGGSPVAVAAAGFGVFGTLL